MQDSYSKHGISPVGFTITNVGLPSQYMTDNNNSRLGLDQAAAGQGSAHNAAQQIVRLRERASAVIQAGAMLKSGKAHICAQTCVHIDAQMLDTDGVKQDAVNIPQYRS